MARVTWSKAAKRDHQDIVEWIARDSLTHAEIWSAKLHDAPNVLERFPEIGAIVEDGDRPGLRELLVRPYRIIYQFEDGVCEILRLVHSSRNLRVILDPENLT